MKRYINIGIIAFLLLLNCYVVVSFVKYKKENSLYIKQLIQEPYKNSVNANIRAGLENTNIVLDNFTVKDTLNNEMRLKSLFGKDQKYLLICRYSKYYCSSCVEYAVKTILNWSDAIGKVNLLFMGEYNNNRFMKKEVPYLKIGSYKVVNKSDLNLPIEKKQFPYYFVLDSNLTVHCVFIPEKYNIGFNAKFLNIIYQRYFKK